MDSFSPDAAICLVGAGNIARIHAEALASPLQARPRRIVCVVDPDLQAARRLCPPGGQVHATLEAALAEGSFGRAHVLTPPDTHAAIARQLLDAGKSVLLEKPLATSRAASMGLSALAGDRLGINQNFVFHPAFLQLRRMLESGSIGRPRSVSCIYAMPLRQLAARQFDHWMFRQPANILLEQAVHPLSQIAALAGPTRTLQATAAPALALDVGRQFHPAFDVLIRGERLPAQLRFAVGESFPFWQVTLVCDDGVAVADMVANRTLRYRRTRWLDLVDGLVSGAATAGGVALASARNFGAGLVSTAGLRARNDPFFLSMRASIDAFHAARDLGQPPPLDAGFGAGLVETCLRIVEAAGLPHVTEPTVPVAASSPDGPASPGLVAVTRPDVAVLGGTGFIGQATVAALQRAGLRVAVLSRSPGNSSEPAIRWHRGSITDPAVVRAAIAGAPAVVNLAHGGGGGDFQSIRTAMAGGAATVAHACLDVGARLIHVSSIAALYLGNPAESVTGATPPDPRHAERADYARAKILTERLLADLATTQLRLTILRPGLVVGAGTSPFHGGLGFYNTEQHCIGWNDGRNPLPFVLVDDVADAILRVCDTPSAAPAYNLVGDVRLSARDYVAELARALQRPLVFHPQSVRGLWAGELAKFAVKRASGRRVPMPPLRDLRSRGLVARFDCGDAVRDLGWHPVADRERFLDQAVRIHARPG
ncbi:NAD-dependent epimerase/dehydratase family protein [Lichenicola sp.]|uniref:NAD-dependent epimerase/dehydratase family protein n=1 Tax=Lichenicola sp. TaxID=2804529 RepID=UPI003B007365